MLKNIVKKCNSPGNRNSPGNFTNFGRILGPFHIFCSFANYCDTFCSILICFKLFFGKKMIFVIRVCRCSLFSVWELVKGWEKIYKLYNLTLFSSKYSKKVKNLFLLSRKTPYSEYRDLKKC